MANTNRVTMLQVTNALWEIEDWVRSLREVLMTQEGATFDLPDGMLASSEDPGGGQIKLIRGCPPPCDPCDDKGKDTKTPGKGKGKNK